MNKAVIFGVLGALLFVANSRAATCVDSAATLDEKKADMPALLRELPMMLSVDKTLVTAAIKIRAIDDKLKLEGAVWTPGCIYTDDSYVSKACVENGTLEVTLENGRVYKAKVESDKALAIEGVSFYKSSDLKFAQVVERIKKAASERAAPNREVQYGTSY